MLKNIEKNKREKDIQIVIILIHIPIHIKDYQKFPRLKKFKMSN